MLELLSNAFSWTMVTNFVDKPDQFKIYIMVPVNALSNCEMFHAHIMNMIQKGYRTGIYCMQSNSFNFQLIILQQKLVRFD